MSTPKFMQTLDQEIYEQLQNIANKRGIKVQELIRAVIIPEWLRQGRGDTAVGKS